MKRLTTLLPILVLLTLSASAQTVTQKPVGVLLERDVADKIWKTGTGESTETFAAIKSALRTRYSLEQIEKSQAKRCRDSCGSGPLDECMRKFVVLTLPADVATEWLGVLESDRLLSARAKREIEAAFLRVGFE